PSDDVRVNFKPNDDGNVFPGSRSTQYSDDYKVNIETSMDDITSSWGTVPSTFDLNAQILPKNICQVQPDLRRSVQIDYSLFTKKSDKVFIALLVYMDDIVINGNDLAEIEKFKLLHEYGLLAAKHVDTPLPENTTLNHIETDDDPLLDNIRNYQKLVGKLIYLNARPDISYVVNCLSQYMHAPLVSHLDVVLRVLRYLKGSPESGIQINKTRNLKLRAYADSD
nr:ribonuclease H-like domain-containing protein [Tanacetum cinerariifolium]